MRNSACCEKTAGSLTRFATESLLQFSTSAFQSDALSLCETYIFQRCPRWNMWNTSRAPTRCVLFLNRRRSFYLLNSPPVDVAVVLSQGEGSLSQPVTLDLTISLTTDSPSLTIKADNLSILIPTEVASTSTPLTGNLLVDSDAPSSLTAEILSAEGALGDASNVMKTMNLGAKPVRESNG